MARKEHQAGINSMTNNTVTLHRVLTTTPERIFKAFSSPNAYAPWIPPYGFLGKMHHMDFRKEGTYKMSFTNFSTDKSHSFGGSYLEIKPNELIRYSSRFDDPNLSGEMTTSIQLNKVPYGTEL
ncbi:SRPBCC domain-containing protein [Flagellimonas olearia]|uniref:SRPBCC domain-containing protein n=1 Tax=Flagellimonas olearia TaxID=552546 RepID=UPI002011B8F5|nr:SRPBCC domain-containing protein [Allomuricauda olearia]